MTPRLFRVWLLAMAAGSSLSLFAQQPSGNAASPETRPSAPAPVTSPAPVEDMVQPFKLSDAPLDLIFPLLENWTGRTILRPQQLPTPLLTLSIKEPIPKSDALRAVETLLNLNQIGLVRMGDKFLKVVPLQNVRIENPQIIEGTSLDLPPSGQIVTKLFQLQFLRVQEFIQPMANLLNGTVSPPVIFEKNNALLVTDTLATIQRIEMLLQKLDQPVTANLSPKFYTIHFAKASDVVNKLRAMLQGALQSQIGSATSYSADDRTNQVILISDPRQHAFFDELIAKLDVKSDPNTRTEVLYLKHATAKDVSSLLSNLVSNQTKATQNSGSVQPGQVVQQNPAPQPQPAGNTNVSAALGELGSSQFSSLVTVIADDRSNAVVVNGTLDDIRLIKDLVDKIDIVLAQVRIEVVIAEVTLSDQSSTGISTLGLDVAGNKLMGLSAAVPGATIGGNSSSTYYYGTTADTGAHGGPYLLGKDQAATAGNVSLVGLISLSTTPRKGNSRILSTPTITTTHNKEAKFFFGETRPVISGSTSSTATSTTTPGYNTSTITQQEIGTTLTVKPLIGNDGSVQLDIKQTISDVQGEVPVDGNTQYIMGKRETDSFITVKSNEIIVLAGIQKENHTHTTSRLGPIPWIGDLLGSRSRTMTRTELVIFIRPTVLTNTSADNEEYMKRVEKMEGAGAIKHELDPKTPEPKDPTYKKLFQIP